MGKIIYNHYTFLLSLPIELFREKKYWWRNARQIRNFGGSVCVLSLIFPIENTTLDFSEICTEVLTPENFENLDTPNGSTHLTKVTDVALEDQIDGEDEGRQDQQCGRGKNITEETKESATGMAREGIRKSTTHKSHTKPILGNSIHYKKARYKKQSGKELTTKDLASVDLLLGQRRHTNSLHRVVKILGEPGVDLVCRNISANFEIPTLKKLYDFAPVSKCFAK